jgi:curved DNA-binding protein CbpA
MTPPKADETYYDILKVEPRATIAEIVAAYHAAKNAFSRDSVATYSLFSPDEAKTVLDRLEEAYLNLSNIDKKREYDKWLAERTQNLELPPTMTEMERKQKAMASQADSESIFPSHDQMPSPEAPPAVAEYVPAAKDAPIPSPLDPEAPPIPITSGEVVTGATLKSIREKRSLSIDDVSRITKIPTKFIRAIEADDLKQLPARVYLQGFVKNLAALYKLDPKDAVKAYFEHTDKLNAPPSPTTTAG